MRGTYDVRTEDDGTFTTVITYNDGRVVELRGYLYMTTARYDGYVACNPPRELTGYGTATVRRRGGWRS